nr:Fic family protein [Cetobacterium sp. 2A]
MKKRIPLSSAITQNVTTVHIIFLGIHPCVDRNGRTSRLLLNL